MQDTEGAREKAKTKFDQAMEELERLLLQKEGESVRDTGIQGRSPGVGGKRALGKAVEKGGLLLKGKNPGNVRHLFEFESHSHLTSKCHRFNDRKTISDCGFRRPLMHIGKR